MDIKVLGVDLAKNVFQLHGVGSRGEVLLKKRISRSELASFIAKLPICLIGVYYTSNRTAISLQIEH